MKIGKKFEKSVNIVMVDKVKFEMDNYTKQYDGVINMLEEPEMFEQWTLLFKDKKLYVGIDEEFNTDYKDPKDVEFNEIVETDGGIPLETMAIGGESFSVDTKLYLDINTKSIHLPEDEFQKLKSKI